VRRFTKEAFLGAFLLGMSLLIVVAAAETFLRMFPQFMPEEAILRLHWQGLRVNERNARNSVVLPDDEIGYLYRPNTTHTIARGDFSFTFTTDEWGFRNESPWPDQADIVVLGDSMAFGYGVSREDGWVARLQEMSSDEAIVNLGLIGTSPEQNLRIFKRFGVGLEPKLVLFTLFPGNDLFDTGNFRRWLAAGKPVSFSEWRTEGEPSIRGFVGNFLESSYLMLFLREARKAANAPFSGHTLTLAHGEKITLAPSTYAGNEELARPDHPDFIRAMQVIEEAENMSADLGAEFVVLLVPTKERVYLPLVGETVPDPVDAFAVELKRRGTPHLDLTDPLQSAAKEGEKVYFEIDGHPNAKGYQLIAEAVNRYLAGLKEASTADGAS
jgi:lysophospholipase L1-like esterase